MKRRLSPAFLYVLCGILLAVMVGAALMRPETAVDPREDIEGFSGSPNRPKIERSSSPNSRERRDTRQALRALKEELLMEFPDLRIEKMQVPDEENGFLQLHLIADEVALASQELLDLISGRSGWDASRVAQLLAEHADLVARIEAIASLEKRSSTDLPGSYAGFVSARTAKVAGELLLAKARLASEAGNEAVALRFAGLTRNLVSHFTEVETRNLLMETTAILMEMNLQKVVLENLLPPLGSSADADAWMSLLTVRSYGPHELAALLQGEWNTSMDYLFPSAVMNPHERLSDWQDLARAYARMTQDSMQRARSGTLREIYGFEHLHPPSQFPNLSSETSESLDQLAVGMDGWTRGYVRAAVVVAMNQAVMELVLLERAGEPLTTEAVSRVTRNPYDDTAFAFDPDTRMLSVPNPVEGLDTDPVRLP